MRRNTNVPRKTGTCERCGRTMKLVAREQCASCYYHHRDDDDDDTMTPAELDALVAKNYATMPDKREPDQFSELEQARRGLSVRLVRLTKHWRGMGVMG